MGFTSWVISAKSLYPDAASQLAVGALPLLNPSGRGSACHD
jgi:hypothetical protein